ncbi:MAG: phosphotransferase, partial [Anaerolineales bacterium]
EAIQQEYANYQDYVKNTLPPVTARIQAPPVVAARPTRRVKRQPAWLGEIAALQYTFIAEPGRVPASMRQRLLADPDPGLLRKLFDTFGPNWWMQRKPYTFRLAQEYDRLLPTHYVIQPESGRGMVLDGRASPVNVSLQIGDLVSLRNFSRVELRLDGKSLSLKGHAQPGQPRLRARWLGLSDPDGATGRVVATRRTLLRDYVAGFELYRLPDPLEGLPALLDVLVSGTQSTIHGDLNLENMLVGPGDFIWLIDFATTRDGHPLFDFAHLEAELIAHVIAPQVSSPREFLELLELGAESAHPELFGLLAAVREIAARCLFNPSRPDEYHLAALMACLGALKFANLEPFQKHLLYLNAADIYVVRIQGTQSKQRMSP